MWTLIVCTYGWLGMCGMHREYPYPTEDSCYRAMNELYESKGEEAFHYLVCKEGG